MKLKGPLTVGRRDRPRRGSRNSEKHAQEPTKVGEKRYSDMHENDGAYTATEREIK
jgi:hypothetical protein